MRGIFIQCGEFIPRYLEPHLSLSLSRVKKYAWKIQAYFSGAKTSILRLSPPNICRVIMCGVHSAQTEVSFSIKQRPPRRTQLRQRSFSRRILYARKERSSPVLSLQASLQKLSTMIAREGEQLPRIAASSLSREGKPTFILHRRASSASLLDQRSPL